VYLPILKNLFDRYEAVGFTAIRRKASADLRAAGAFRRSAGEWMVQAKPELLIVAVPGRLNEETVANLLDFKVPILAETPLAWSISGALGIIEKAAEKSVLLGVAEQFPFCPANSFGGGCWESGALGDLYGALNDFHSYSYHGVAQFRRYLKGRPVQAQCREFRMSCSLIDRVPPRWQSGSGSVAFDDGTMLFHNFAAPDFGIPRRICLYGTLGKMQNDGIRLTRGKGVQSEIFHGVVWRTRLILLHRSQPILGPQVVQMAFQEKPLSGQVYILRNVPSKIDATAISASLKGTAAYGLFHSTFSHSTP
jgi:hypothetical protein